MQQRAAQLTEIQRFQETRIRLKTEAEEHKLNTIKENQERIRMEKIRHKDLMASMKKEKLAKLCSEAQQLRDKSCNLTKFKEVQRSEIIEQKRGKHDVIRGLELHAQRKQEVMRELR